MNKTKKKKNKIYYHQKETRIQIQRFYSRGRNVDCGMGSAYVALFTYHEFQLPSESEFRTETPVSQFYIEFEECLTLQILPPEFEGKF